MESAHFIKTKTMLPLSAQQGIDCIPTSSGCWGGFVSDYFEYSIEHPIALESDYPYTTDQAKVHRGVCKDDSIKGVVSCTKSPTRVKSGESASLKAAIEITPVVVSINSEQRWIYGYESGILNTPECGSYRIGHNMVVIGWGNDGTQDYYIAKNSFGAAWGEKGYIRIAATETGNGICGIQMQLYFPTTN